MKNKTIKKIVLIIMCITMLFTLLNKVIGANTDYIDKNIKKEKGVGLAVIESNDVDVKSYFYLYYDDKGEVHTVQYLLNEMWSDNENSGNKSTKKDDIRNKKYILRTDADNYKAKQLGAKEYYNSEEELEADKSKEATELYKKIEKDVGNNKTLYDYIEGTDDNLEPYTIESIIFNEVPIFDVNVFSDKAGGKEISEDSPVGIIRQLVAVWFVSFRNVTLVVLVILILYYGIRIAISTVASEKARFKEMLLGWLKCLILTLMVHIIMYLVLETNERMVDIFKNVNKEEGSIYNTIRARTMENPWKVSIPAVLLYLTLLIMWIRFIWSYFKRLFTVMFLIILAPIVLARYGIQSASGKGSQMVSNWLQRFCTAVFIQSIHAMLYVAFVQSALKIALEDLHGFFIALFFLNFIISADTIFANIFKFQFNPDDVREMGKPFEPRKQLVGAYLTYNVTKRFIGTADEVAVGAGRVLKNAAYKGYLTATDAIDSVNGGNSREEIEGFINDKLDKFDDLFINQKFDKNGKPIQEDGLQGTLNEIFTLRKMSRAKGMNGATAKRILRLKKNAQKRKFMGNFRIVRDIGKGAIETIFAIPVGVQNPGLGVAMAADGPSTLINSRRAHRRMVENEEKQNRRLNSTVRRFMITGHNQDIIEEEIEKLSEADKTKAVRQMKKVDEYNINSYQVINRIQEIMEMNEIEELNDSTIDFVVNEVVNGISGDLTDEERARIKEATLNALHQGTFESEVGNRNRNAENDARERADRQQQNREDDTTDSSASNTGNNPGDDSDGDSAQSSEQTGSRSTGSDNENNTNENSQNARRSRNRRNQNDEENDDDKRTFTFRWGEVAEAIEDAVLETKVENRFVKMAKAINNIKNENNREYSEEDGEEELVNINKFLDSL